MDLPALKHLPLPIFICNAAGRLTFTNEVWQQQLGIAIGDSWLKVFPELDEKQFQQLWIRCTEQNDPQRLSAAAVTAAESSVWFDIVLQPMIDEQQQTLLLGALTDVTDRTVRVAEIQAILDTAVDAIITIDQDGVIEGFNQSASHMFEYPAEQVIGQNIRMLMPEPHRSAHDGYMQRYLNTGEARIIDIGRELTALDAGGREFPIYLAVSEIQVAGRRRFTGIVRDLTEQQASREALAEQREKLAHVGRLSTMGEMTASIAHEINQPLTAISMYAQAGLKLLERGGDDDKLKDAIEKLNVQALRAGAVIERIQRFAKSQEGVREIIDPNALVLDLLKLAESDARLHAMELVLDLAEGLPQLYVDPIQIQQVALNLIRNAIDAMNEIACRNGREIVITSRLLNNASGTEVVEIAVADLGPGVAEDQLDLLFTPFHTTKREGMGMGLSICRSIISEHGGELSYLNNTARGQGPGATFYFQLPVTADD
jgi:two-component system sensor kinase FixL